MTGTFVGSGGLGPQTTGLVVATTFTLALQQVSPPNPDLPVPTPIRNSLNALSGTIDVAGLPCFTHGATVSNSGSVFGDMVGVIFTMDDGSRLTLHGTIKDPSTSAIIGTTALVEGGQCDGWAGFFDTSLARQ